MRLSVRTVKFAAYLYMYLGLCVFFLGWVRPVFSVPLVLACALVCRCYHRRLRACPGEGGDVLPVSWPMLAATVLFAIALLYHVTGADDWKKQCVVLACLLLFGTCIALGKALYGMTAAGQGDGTDELSWISGTIRLQYRSLLVHLRWAFPQAIVPWMATLLFADDVKAARGYGPLCVPLLLYSPFALIGLVLMMLAVAGYRLVTEKSAAVMRELFSVENILSVAIALAPIVYLLGNVLGDKPLSAGFAVVDYRPAPALYFCFTAAFLVYSAAVFSQCRRDILFYLVNATLLLVPFFTMGVWNDLSLNVTIPAILLLMVLVVKTLFACMERPGQHWKRLVVLAALLACGSLAPLDELKAAVNPPPPLSESAAAAYRSLTLNDWARRDGTVAADNAYNYFTYDYTDSLFYNVLARK